MSTQRGLLAWCVYDTHTHTLSAQTTTPTHSTLLGVFSQNPALLVRSFRGGDVDLECDAREEGEARAGSQARGKDGAWTRGE